MAHAVETTRHLRSCRLLVAVAITTSWLSGCAQAVVVSPPGDAGRGTADGAGEDAALDAPTRLDGGSGDEFVPPIDERSVLGGSPSQEDACLAYGARWCDFRQLCLPMFGRVYGGSRALCIDFVSRECLALARSGGLRDDFVPHMRACIDEMSTWSCRTPYATFDGSSACQFPVSFGGEGARCISGYACGEDPAAPGVGLHCRRPLTGCRVGVCTHGMPDGTPCDPYTESQQCELGSTCGASRDDPTAPAICHAVVMGRLDGPCGDFCPWNSWCDQAANRCRAALPSGGACDPFELMCDLDSLCLDGACVRGAEAYTGDSCDPDASVCASATVCDRATRRCVDLPVVRGGEGARCGTTLVDCLDGLDCIIEGYCSACLYLPHRPSSSGATTIDRQNLYKMQPDGTARVQIAVPPELCVQHPSYLSHDEIIFTGWRCAGTPCSCEVGRI